MGFLIFTIYLIARFSQVSLHFQLFSSLVAAKEVTYSVLDRGNKDGKYDHLGAPALLFQLVKTQRNWDSKLQWVEPAFLFSFNPSVSPLQPSGALPSSLEEIIETQCQNVPTGDGIPAFQPGIGKADVMQMLGMPTGTARGYWPNTRAVFYELIPNQVSLGFLFDRHTERIRQTEASFTAGTDPQTVLLTLNGMLGCQLNEQIQQGLQQVWQRETGQYSFRLGSLEGVIERQKGDRLYIGIWEEDLH